MSNRIQALLGIEYPIVQAPMTYIARAELAAAVSEAGGLGVIETPTQKALEAGVDALVVEGVEGGGFKSALGASTMALLPLVAECVDLPIIAAGGMCDARSTAAAVVLGAEGVQMGTRMLASRESLAKRCLTPQGHESKATRSPARRPGLS